jgi:hypothetical protein
LNIYHYIDGRWAGTKTNQMLTSALLLLEELLVVMGRCISLDGDLQGKTARINQQLAISGNPWSALVTGEAVMMQVRHHRRKLLLGIHLYHKTQSSSGHGIILMQDEVDFQAASPDTKARGAPRTPCNHTVIGEDRRGMACFLAAPNFNRQRQARGV